MLFSKDVPKLLSNRDVLVCPNPYYHSNYPYYHSSFAKKADFFRNLRSQKPSKIGQKIFLVPILTQAEGVVTGTAVKMFTVAGPVIVFGTAASAVYGLILWAVK